MEAEGKEKIERCETQGSRQEKKKVDKRNYGIEETGWVERMNGKCFFFLCLFFW